MPRFLGIAAIIAVALPGSGLAQVSSLTDSVTRVLPGEPASFNLGAGTDAGVEPAVAHLLSASLTFGAVDSLSPSSLGGRRLAPMEEIRLASRVAETATRPDRETAARRDRNPRTAVSSTAVLHLRAASSGSRSSAWHSAGTASLCLPAPMSSWFPEIRQLSKAGSAGTWASCGISGHSRQWVSRGS